MSKKEKLLEKLKLKPKDFTYQEAKTLLEWLGFYENQKGKTSGSRVQFIHKQSDYTIDMHKPHSNGNVLKPYQIDKILTDIKKIGGIKNG